MRPIPVRNSATSFEIRPSFVKSGQQTQQKDMYSEQEAVNAQIEKNKSEELTLRLQLAQKNKELLGHQQGISNLAQLIQQVKVEYQQAEIALKSAQSVRDTAAKALEVDLIGAIVRRSGQKLQFQQGPQFTKVPLQINF